MTAGFTDGAASKRQPTASAKDRHSASLCSGPPSEDADLGRARLGQAHDRGTRRAPRAEHDHARSAQLHTRFLERTHQASGVRVVAKVAPSRRTTVFTAPIARAVGVTSSISERMATL